LPKAHGRYEYPVPEHQVDSVTIIANPISGTRYEWRAGATGAGALLGDQLNVRILSASLVVTWATTQPDPIEIHFTIDGILITHAMFNPVTMVPYSPYKNPYRASLNALTQAMIAVNTADLVAIEYEGRSIKVECEIIWAITQPTNLIMRIKWAQW